MKAFLSRYFKKNQNLIAFAWTALAVVLLAGGLFRSPISTILDNGEYTYYLSEFGLNYTEEDLADLDAHYYNWAIETYTVERTPWEALLLVKPVHSLVYPVSVLGSVCRLLGVHFSTQWLAALLSLLLLFGFYITLKSLYVYLRGWTALAGALACAVLFCGSYLVIFNSLYPQSMFLVGGWLFCGAFLRALAVLRKGEKGFLSVLWPLTAAGVLLVTSCELAALICPIVVILYGLVVLRCIRAGLTLRGKVGAAACMVLLLYASTAFFLGQNHLFNQANLYHSFFDGVLVYSEEPAETLREFDMDEGLAADIGKSYYEDAETFYIAPGSEEAQEAIYSKLSYGRIAAWYVTHPAALRRALNQALEESAAIEDELFIYSGQTTTDGDPVTRLDGWAVLRGLSPGWIKWCWWLMSLAAVLYAVLKRGIRGKVLLCGAAAGNLLLFLSVLAAGEASLGQRLLPFQYFSDALLVVEVFGFLRLLRRGSAYLLYPAFGRRQRPAEIYHQEEYSALVWRTTRFRRLVCTAKEMLCSLAENPVRLAAVSTCCAGVIMASVLFFPRIGAYNNGDFGRMMDAMQLTYTPEDYYNTADQYSTKVIENYRFLEPYDWSQLRPGKALLSQTYLSALARVLYSLTGMQFSTVTIAVVYVLVLLLCFYQYMHMAQRFCGKYAVLVGLGYILLFCGSANLGWLNSLYGEAVGFVGLNAVIAASLRLLEAPRGKGGMGWPLYFFASVLFLGGKAQYVVSLPVLILWTVVLMLYHWPQGRVRRGVTVLIGLCLCWFCVTEGLHIYSYNASISSQDTLVQGLYNGILVVADDPEEALEELGLDTGLAADAGKSAYEDPDSYYCAPRTDMAEELIYSRVSTIDYLLWYLKHPAKLLYILNVAAKAARDEMPDYILYVGDRTDSATRRTVEKLALWKDIRPLLTPRSFWGYVLVFGAIFLFCLRELLLRHGTLLYRMGIGLFLTVILCGILQYPLSVIGNGFSDNIKQLYLFREIWDGTLLVAGTWLALHAKQLLHAVRRSERLRWAFHRDGAAQKR